jgi:hypothetical protein
LKQANDLTLAVDIDCDRYLDGRTLLLEEQLQSVNRAAAANELPDAIITDSGLKVTPLANAVPADAEALMRKAYAQFIDALSKDINLLLAEAMHSKSW